MSRRNHVIVSRFFPATKEYVVVPTHLERFTKTEIHALRDRGLVECVNEEMRLWCRVQKTAPDNQLWDRGRVSTHIPDSLQIFMASEIARRGALPEANLSLTNSYVLPEALQEAAA